MNFEINAILHYFLSNKYLKKDKYKYIEYLTAYLCNNQDIEINLYCIKNY